MSTIATPAPTPSQVPGALGEAQIARRETLGQLARSKTFLAGALMVLFWVFWAIVGSRLTPHDPLAQSPDILKGLGKGHWFGTDQLGRDVLSRVLAGSSDTLQVAPLATLLGIAGGTTVGLVTGYFLGLVDETISRVVDAVLALPLIVIAVTALVALGSSKVTLIVVIGVVFTPIVSRTVRAAVLGEREPNVMGPIIVEATVRLGYAIFAVAGLTFLGFGVQPPSPDWSLQIADNYQLLNAGTYEWTVLFPGLAIASLIVGVNLVADGLQQVLDR